VTRELTSGRAISCAFPGIAGRVRTLTESTHQVADWPEMAHVRVAKKRQRGAPPDEYEAPCTSRAALHAESKFEQARLA
jgi:hypothetical protein